MQLYQSQAISVEQLLEHGDFPFADELLQSNQITEGTVGAGQSARRSFSRTDGASAARSEYAGREQTEQCNEVIILI